MSVHEFVRRRSPIQFSRRQLSPGRLVIVAGALAAALAGADVGAVTRPAAPRAGQTLGPRIDFDRAAHPATSTAWNDAEPGD